MGAEGLVGGPLKAIEALQDVPTAWQSQIYYVVFEHLMAEPVAVLQDLHHWLGLAPTPFDPEHLPVQPHESDSHYRCKYPHRTYPRLQPPAAHPVPPRIARELQHRFADFLPNLLSRPTDLFGGPTMNDHRHPPRFLVATSVVRRPLTLHHPETPARRHSGQIPESRTDRVTYSLLAFAGLVLGALAGVLLTASPAAAASDCDGSTINGNNASVVTGSCLVPSGVTWVRIDAIGGGGGGGASSLTNAAGRGGHGAMVTTYQQVTPGAELSYTIGGGGGGGLKGGAASANTFGGVGFTAGGIPGPVGTAGGTGNPGLTKPTGGGGGGSTRVVSGTDVDVIAGGGGGGGGVGTTANLTKGGDAAAAGTAAGQAGSSNVGRGGGGANPPTGGAGGTNNGTAGGNGTSGTGGNGGPTGPNSSTPTGGGGGGGYGGGGGGAASSGGGGSGGSYRGGVGSATATTTYKSVSTDAGQGGGGGTTSAGTAGTAGSVTITPLPCGPGIGYATGLWQQLALPCVPSASPAQVGSVLGANTNGQLDASIYGNAGALGWLMYGNDLANNKNLKLAVTDTLSNGGGYWIKSFSAPAGGGNLTVTGTATPAPVTTGDGCASANGCTAIAVTTVAGADRYNLVGNPFAYNVDWAQVRVRVKQGATLIGAYTPSQAAGIGTGAASPPVMSNTIWIYNGTAYETWSDTSLPNPGNLKYFQSFWVKVLAAAYGYTVELLIPAEASTHSQFVPARDSRYAATGQPWYLAWLDWLIPPAAADSFPSAAAATDFAPGQHPAARPLRGQAPPAIAAPVAPVADPTLDLLTTQGITTQGLAPSAAERAAHATALAEGREWYVRLLVDEPATGYRDHNSVIGQLLDARNGYDPRDLAELPPFGKPYLTLVFPHPEWGAQAGDYGSDFRAAQGPRLGRRPPVALPPGDWPFQIRADRPGTPVILRWAGDPAILQRSQLIDQTTRKTINLRAYPQGYPVTLTTGTRAFIWRYLGQNGATR
jgi:hypothetical protein